jgi:uncharacterized protein with PIN domain
MRIHLRCYAELNDLLPAAERQRTLTLELVPPVTVRSLAAARGIPPGRIELALVDGRSVPLEAELDAGARVSLYPVFESMDVTPLLRLRDRPLRRVRFVADAHLGRLARYLRLLGFDTLFENDPGDAALARISAHQGRILLTRDRALLERRLVTHGLWVPATRPRSQLVWVVERLDLWRLFRPFTRCTVCNGVLREVTRNSLQGRVPPRVLAAFDAFWRCRGCGRVYWRGSHYDRLRMLVDQLRPGGGGVVAG